MLFTESPKERESIDYYSFKEKDNMRIKWQQFPEESHEVGSRIFDLIKQSLAQMSKMCFSV